MSLNIQKTKITKYEHTPFGTIDYAEIEKKLSTSNDALKTFTTKFDFSNTKTHQPIQIILNI